MTATGPTGGDVLGRRLALAALAAGALAALALLAFVQLRLVPAPALPFAGESGEVAAERSYAQLPLAFEQNAGQAPGRFDFLARSESGTAAISDRGALISLPAAKKQTDTIAINLVGASTAQPTPLAELPGKVNYLVGDDPAKHRTGLATYERIRYASVYPGIDLEWYGNQRRLEYDFLVSAGADPSRITTRIAGAKELSVAPNGDLVIDTGPRTLRQRAPLAYQTLDGTRQRVAASYAVDGKRVSFSLGSYDTTKPLVIDPLVLAYSTYLGGNDFDVARGIAVDSAGAAYVAGSTASSDFNRVGGIEGDSVGQDAFVSKLTPAGSALAYSTYLGGNSIDIAEGIAVDSAGAAYVAGRTDSTNFNRVGGIEGDSAGGDAFVSKLAPAGSALSYSTYLGGNDWDVARGIAVDSAGAAYVAGETLSSDFNRVGAIEGDSAGEDAFVSKLTPAGSALAYSTYLGGNDNDVALGVAVDSRGAAYVTGWTASTDFNTVNRIEGNNADTDAFVSKLIPAGSALSYSTYLGGNDNDVALEIAVDSRGAAYVAGRTDSTDFNTVKRIEGKNSDSADDDAFVSKLTPAGSALAFSTYLGGNGGDAAYGIAVDSGGAAYVAGSTSSTNFNTVNRIEGDSAGEDAFVSKLTPAGSALAYSTYLGGNGGDIANAVAVDSAGAAYVAGYTSSSDFDRVGGIEGNSASQDAFVAKLRILGVCRGRNAEPFTGTAGPNAIDGTAGSDEIHGGGGGDWINAQPGDDCAYGEAGDDLVEGDDDDDLLSGGDGDDAVTGGLGNDEVSGDAGNDRAKGNGGADRVDGGGGKDVVKGSDGKDRLKGSGGRDKVIGGPGKDKLKGGGGKDKLKSADNKRDKVNCGSGRDKATVDRRDKVAKNCESVKLK